MRIFHAIAALVLTSTLGLVNAADGLIAVKSPHGAKVTMDRLEDIVKQRGLNVFARIDHAAGATKVGAQQPLHGLAGFASHCCTQAQAGVIAAI